MYEDLVGKRVRVIKSDDFVKYGWFETIICDDWKDPKSPRVMKLVFDNGKPEYIRVDAIKSVEERGAGP